MMPVEKALFVAGLLLFFGILASKASHRLGVPALLLFLAIGMLAGSEGPGGIPFDDPYQAQFIGVLALAFILFAGGLETDAGSMRRIVWQGLSLSTLGVLLTALLVGIFTMSVLGLSWLEGLLLGAIVSSTDAAAVFSVLRSQSIGLKGDTRPLLELESGSNDPMAVFLTTAVLGLLTNSDTSVWNLVPLFLLQMLLGSAFGIGIGRATVWVLNQLRLESDGLYPVVTLATVLFTYSVTALLGGNGFLAVYLAGIVMGGSDFIHKRSLIRFHDGIAWLMQMGMFLVLGLLVFPSRLIPVSGAAILTAVFLLLVARPVAVFVALLFARLRFRQKLFISWVGLRGAVPIVLATFPYLAGLPRADYYFNVVFFTVLTSVLLQGTTIVPVAKLLKLDTPLPQRRQYPLEFVPAARSDSDLVEIIIPDTSPVIGRRIMDIRLPKSGLIVLVSRGEEFLAPRGATNLERGDRLLVLAPKKDIGAVRVAIEGLDMAPDQAAAT
jgi:potassium/hydrogen antiporter